MEPSSLLYHPYFTRHSCGSSSAAGNCYIVSGIKREVRTAQKDLEKNVRDLALCFSNGGDSVFDVVSHLLRCRTPWRCPIL